MSRRVTQADVARLAGVSQATVSLVVSGKASGGGIPKDTRERIEAAIHASGYVANPIAQSLAGRRSGLVGVFTFEHVFPADASNFYFPFLAGIEQEAEALGSDLVLFTSSANQNVEARFEVAKRRFPITDGCILLGRRHPADQLARLRDERFPFVFVGRREIPGGDVPHVTADYGPATLRLAERLLEAGHRRIAYVRSDDLAIEPSWDRQTGYVSAMSQADLGSEVDISIVGRDDSSVDGLLDRLIDNEIRAVMVEQTIFAEQLSAAANRRSMSVPHDLSVVVLGDTTGVVTPSVDWTRFELPRFEMGRAALRLLADRVTRGDSAANEATLACEFHAGSTIASPPSKGNQ